MKLLTDLATTHSFRVHHLRAEDTSNIDGKYGQIYDYDDDRLAVMIMPVPPRRGLWVRSRAKFLALGMSVHQNGDDEGSATFDPANPAQAKAAIAAIKVRKVRKLSSEHRSKLLAIEKNTLLRAG